MSGISSVHAVPIHLYFPSVHGPFPTGHCFPIDFSGAPFAVQNVALDGTWTPQRVFAIAVLPFVGQ